MTYDNNQIFMMISPKKGPIKNSKMSYLQTFFMLSKYQALLQF